MRNLPFVPIRTAAVGGREVARFVCTRCEAHAESPLVKSGDRRRMNPEATIKRVEAVGWRINGERVECPRCHAASAARAAGEKPDPKPIPTTAKVIPMADPKVREATPQERVKIRAILDKYFDDAAGCWLDSYSDQKAGEEIGVPWALVTRIREAAYGPIRVDPEVAALRAEMTQIGRELAALVEKHSAAQKRLDAMAAKRAA